MTTFGSTTAIRFASSISRIRFRRSSDRTTPPRSGTAPPVCLSAATRHDRHARLVAEPHDGGDLGGGDPGG